MGKATGNMLERKVYGYADADQEFARGVFENEGLKSQHVGYETLVCQRKRWKRKTLEMYIFHPAKDTLLHIHIDE
jgi:hypothetical protein